MYRVQVGGDGGGGWVGGWVGGGDGWWCGCVGDKILLVALRSLFTLMVVVLMLVVWMGRVIECPP